jgi:hypothetical protein
MPDVLEPERVEPYRRPEEFEAHHERVVEALRRACEYGQMLWHELDQTRRYLLDEVARGGRNGPVVSSEPLLKSEQDWQIWADRYAAAFDALCGPHGDESLGRQEARHEAQQHNHLIREPT